MDNSENVAQGYCRHSVGSLVWSEMPFGAVPPEDSDLWFSIDFERDLIPTRPIVFGHRSLVVDGWSEMVNWHDYAPFRISRIASENDALPDIVFQCAIT